ncbi:MAG: DNA mismatch repair endonuclease MutL [Candidatus Latescibacteria bacterium]|nr:DNA mismatch repair endonuclease MutL [Candidatus Latescibacterota bacterium]
MNPPTRQSIRALSPETVNRIAAGEVVERPASVLKELLENAIDAGASSLELEIAGGGIALLRLADDGHGIPRDELALALERHATSKIRGLEDLARGDTLGFRGEALAAIASVSLLEIVSRVEDDDSAWALSGGEATNPRPAARGRGTTVTVRELFGNLPARRKFLRTESGEKRRLLDVWTTAVLAYPELRFVLREGGRELSHYPPVASARERAAAVLGETTARHMVDVSADEAGFRLRGLATLPLVSRGNRSHQFLYLGRRPVEDRQVSHAIAQAYADVLAPGRFPAVLLFLEAPAGSVDVNVHPAKREVRFRDGRLVHHLVSSALRAAIGERGGLKRHLESREAPLLGAQRVNQPTGFAAAPAPAPEQRELTLPAGSRPAQPRSAREPGFLRLGESADARHHEPDREERRFWQLHDTFILTQIRGGLVIIDQHNAHERVIYDRARAALSGERAGTQGLLFPHTVELGPTEMAAWEEFAVFFEELGFRIEPFGATTLQVTGIPDTLRRWEGGRVIRDILDEVIAESGGLAERRDRALISFSCKSAIKAGEPLREEEMRHLVDQLFGTENPYTCPHGRPIVIRISMDELEKRFHRRVPGELGDAPPR